MLLSDMTGFAPHLSVTPVQGTGWPNLGEFGFSDLKNDES
jgi:hypothetical protein